MAGKVDMSHFGVVDQSVTMMKHVESYITVGMDMALDVANDLGECDLDKETKACEESIKDIMLDYIKMERDFKQFIDSVKHVKQQVATGTEYDKMEDILHQKVAELKQTNDDSLITTHDKYKDLMEKIQEVRNPAPVDNSDLKAIALATEEDEDVEMTQPNIVTKCPYTGQEMTNPVKNKICGHSYEKEGILEHISKRKHKARCPVSGCSSNQVVTTEDLEVNKDLRRFIERKRRQDGQRKTKKK